jgi:hypothetical protein
LRSDAHSVRRKHIAVKNNMVTAVIHAAIAAIETRSNRAAAQ